MTYINLFIEIYLCQNPGKVTIQLFKQWDNHWWSLILDSAVTLMTCPIANIQFDSVNWMIIVVDSYKQNVQ